MIEAERPKYKEERGAITTKIIKRDGREVPFDYQKIAAAITKANETVPEEERITQWKIQTIAENIESACYDKWETPTVEGVQDMVEKALMQSGKYAVAKNYITYRYTRSVARDASANLMKTIGEITNVDARESDLKRDNANIDGNSPMGAMLQIGAAGAKAYNEAYLLRPEHAKAYREGYTHIHDFDFYSLTMTCCQIDLLKLFHGGFSTGHGYLREPQSIQSYAALAAIAIQANQNDQHGGQSVPNFDYAMAEGIKKSFAKDFNKVLEEDLEVKFGVTEATAAVKEAMQAAEKASGEKVRIVNKKEFDAAAADRIAAYYGYAPDSALKFVKRVRKKATEKVNRETYQAMEGFVHNLNTMHSRAGAQTPFSSINYGTDTSPEGRMVMKNLLLATDAGLGHGETCIFPIQIFKVKEGVNYNPGDPNYDLFRLACKVSAKRLFPNFVFIDAPFNLQYYKPGCPETEVVSMGAVTGDDVITIRVDGKWIETLPFCVAYNRYALNSDRRIEILDRGKFVDILKWHNYPDAGDWYDVHFDNGRYLRMTSDHPLPTQRGRIECKDLVVGDKVPLSNMQVPLVGNNGCCVPPIDPWLLGVMVCDGNTNCTISLGMDERDIAEKIVSLCPDGAKIKEQHRGSKGNYLDVAISHGGAKTITKKAMEILFGSGKKADRRLPSGFLCWSEVDRLALLAGIIDSDGYINNTKKTYAHIGSTNKVLALEELLLVESLGFHGKLYKTAYGKGEDNPRYSVQFRITRDIPVVSEKKRSKIVVVDDVLRNEYAEIKSITFIGPTGERRYDVTTASDRFDVSGLNSHNCRTRVMGNVYDPSQEISFSRGNLSFTSINLPRLAIEAHGDEAAFYQSLEAMMDLVYHQLLDRFEIQAEKRVYNFPFLMGQGVWLDSDKLGPEDKVREVIKHGSLSTGFIGLAEALTALYGHHHGESPEAQEKGLQIIRFMREYCDRRSQEKKMNFTLLATPAEGLSGRFIRIDQKRYGKIPGVTDREYYTNSFHIPVWFPISAYDKIRLEAPYHALCNAGHITYVEMDGDTARNVEAFEAIVRYMHDCGVGYGSINHPVDRDPVCGYVGVIGDVCPRCGRHDGEAIPQDRIAELRKMYPDIPVFRGIE